MARILGSVAGAQPRPLRAAIRTGRLTSLVDSRTAVEGLALLAILGLAAGVRFSYLGSTPLRLDEPFSLEIARLAPLDVIRESAASDTHPPLYYLLLHGWMELFGDSAFSLRSLSAVFGIAAVGALYAAGRLLGGSRVGLLAALLLALSAFHVTYSQEARNYSLLALTAGLSFAFFLKVVRQGGRGAQLGYVLSTAALLYTHVYGLFAVLAQVAVLAVLLVAARGRGRPPRRELRGFGPLLALVGALYAPWVVVLVVQTGQELEGGADANLAWLTAPGLRWLPGTFSRFAGSLPALLLTLAVLLVAVVERLGRGRMALRRGAAGPRALVPASWIAASTAVPFAVSVAILPIYQVKYTIAASLGYYLLVAVAVSTVRARVVRALATAVVIAAASFTLWQWYDTPDKDYWRGFGRPIGPGAAEVAR